MTLIRIREKPPDVAHSRRAQQRVDQRVQQHVRVGMAKQARFVRNLDAADDQPASRGK
jgi:hypothetical protein